MKALNSTSASTRARSLYLRGDLDFATAPKPQHAVTAPQRQQRLVIDLREFDFTGVRAIHAQRRDDGVDFALVRGPSPVQRAFDLSRLTPQLRWMDP